MAVLLFSIRSLIFSFIFFRTLYMPMSICVSVCMCMHIHAHACVKMAHQAWKSGDFQGSVGILSESLSFQEAELRLLSTRVTFPECEAVASSPS